MNHILCEINKKIQSKACSTTVPPCTVWQKGSFVHISLSSTGCFFRKAGTCTMCDYGCGESLLAEGLKDILDSAFACVSEPVDELLFGTCGSVLDKQEIEPDIFHKVLEYIKPLKINSLIFETHYTTVTESTLQELKNGLDSFCGEIIIEMGLESADEFVLNNCWNKPVDLAHLEETVKLIKGFGFGVVLNVMAGAPFLNVAQQIGDTVNAAKYAVSIGADRVDIFPVNIKKNTVIGILFENRKYKRPSLWMLAEILRLVPDESLAKIEFSWFGDRQESGIAMDAIAPVACEECRKDLHKLFRAVMGTYDVATRRRIVDTFFIEKTEPCGCFSDFIDSITFNTPYLKSDVLSQIDKLTQEIEL